MEGTKKLVLSLVLLTLFVPFSFGQSVDLTFLNDLNQKPLAEIQHQMVQSGFHLVDVAKNKSNKADSVIYKNSAALLVTYQLRKNEEENSVTLNYQDSESYLAYSEELNGANYKLLHTEIVQDKGIQSYYIAKQNGKVISLLASYSNSTNVKSSPLIIQEYAIQILSLKDSNRLSRKWKTKF
ncbi:hypothetical protein ACFRAE_06430 [Sphingobacterium sp. HJSM2_6]|uniref:hypothetical protein n=1 Tax=Sphingobacterium sp. HJSM2_6 TaxID=3366264 RepID=UPI003BC04714